MSSFDAITSIVMLVIIPTLVWILGRTGWTGDRKRIVVIVVSLFVATLQGVVSGVIILPDGWSDIVGRALITGASFFALTNSVYISLRAKLPDTNEPAPERELVEDKA